MDPELTAFAHEKMPFTKEIGLEIVSGEPTRVEARADWTAERCTSNGVLHGGYLMSLADSMGGMMAFLNLPDDAIGTTTIESKTNFVRAAGEGEVTLVAEAIHRGRTTVVVQTDIFRDDGKLVTRTTQTQLVLRP